MALPKHKINSWWWLHPIQERSSCAAAKCCKPQRLDHTEALTGRHVYWTGTAFWVFVLFFFALSLMNRAEETHYGYTHIPKPQTACSGKSSVLITTRSLLLEASSPCFSALWRWQTCIARHSQNPVQQPLPEQGWEQPCLHAHVCKPTLLSHGTDPNARTDVPLHAPALAVWFVKVRSHLVKISHSCPFRSLLLLTSPSTSVKSCPSSFHCPSSSGTGALSRGRSCTPDPSQEQRHKHVPSHLTKQSHYTSPVKALLLVTHAPAARAESSVDHIEDLGLKSVFVRSSVCIW